MLKKQQMSEISERKLAEEDLQKNKAMFEGLFESAPDAIVVVDKEGRIVRINSQAETMFGYNREELVKQRVEILIPDRFKRQHVSHFIGYVNDPHTRPMGEGLELYGKRKNGEEFPIDINLAPLRIGGDFLALSIIRDITDRKRAEDARRLSEAKYSGILSIAADSIISVDESQKITIFNEGAENTFGYSQAEILGMPLEVLIPERFCAAHAHHIRDFAASSIVARRMGERREIFARRKNGEEFPAEASISKLQVGGENIYTVVLRDITDRKMTETELREAQAHLEQRVEERTAALLRINETLQAEIAERRKVEEEVRKQTAKLQEQAHVVDLAHILVRDMDNRIVLWNTGTQKMYGWTKEEAVGQISHVLLNTQFQKPIEEIEAEFLSTGIWEGEIVHTKRNGTKIVVATLWVLRKDEKGKPSAILEVNTDITERKRADDFLKASLEEKEILLKEIHHRVKNNLQVISSLLNLQSRYINDPHALETFKDSQNRVKSMALIHEQLYQSKNLAEVDFEKYVQSLAYDLFVSFGTYSRNIAMKVNIKDISLNIDTAIPCGLIINELISNSLKYAFQAGGDGSIEVGLRPIEDDRYALTVKDSGTAFPKDLDIGNTSSLGLRLVNSLTNQLKGSIALSTCEGTEFTITFSALRYKERM